MSRAPDQGHITKGCTNGINRLNLRAERASVKPGTLAKQIMERKRLHLNQRHPRLKKFELLISTAFANVNKSYPQPMNS